MKKLLIILLMIGIVSALPIYNDAVVQESTSAGTNNYYQNITNNYINQSSNFTNVCFLNNTQTFTGENTFSGDVNFERMDADGDNILFGDNFTWAQDEGWSEANVEHQIQANKPVPVVYQCNGWNLCYYIIRNDAQNQLILGWGGEGDAMLNIGNAQVLWIRGEGDTNNRTLKVGNIETNGSLITGVCKSNGSDCASSSIETTNICYVNNSNNFTEVNYYNNDIRQTSGLFFYSGNSYIGEFVLNELDVIGQDNIELGGGVNSIIINNTGAYLLQGSYTGNGSGLYGVQSAFNQTLTDTLYIAKNTIQYEILDRDIVSINSTKWNSTGLVFTVDARRNYTMDCNFWVYAGLTSTGGRFNISFPSSLSNLNARYYHAQSATAIRAVSCSSTTQNWCYDDDTASVTATTGMPVDFHADFQVIAGGTVNVTFRSEIENAWVALKRGSTCEVVLKE